MKTFNLVTTLDEWGAFDDGGFRFEDDVRATFGALGFTVCVIDGLQIAVVTEAIDPTTRERLERAPRPARIDAVCVATRQTPADDRNPKIVLEVITPADLDPQTLAFASVCVLESHGSFTVTVNRYEVCIGARTIEVMVDWDRDTGARFGTAVELAS